MAILDADTKLQLETNWNDNAMNMAGNKTWFKFHSRHRLQAHYLKEFVLWKCPDTAGLPPQILQIYQVNGFAIDPQSGVTMRLRPLLGPNPAGRYDFIVTSKPRELPDGSVFIWMQPFFNVVYAPENYMAANDTKVLSLPFCIKTCTNPSRELHEGGCYLHAKTEFRSGFPDVTLPTAIS